MFCCDCMCNKTSFLSDFARLTELGGFPRTSPCPRVIVPLCTSDEAATLSFPRRGPAASCLSCERDEESKSTVEGPAHCSSCSSAMSSCDSPSILLLLAPCNSSCARRTVKASVIAASLIAVLPSAGLYTWTKDGVMLGEHVLKNSRIDGKGSTSHELHELVVFVLHVPVHRRGGEALSHLRGDRGETCTAFGDARTLFAERRVGAGGVLGSGHGCHRERARCKRAERWQRRSTERWQRRSRVGDGGGAPWRQRRCRAG